MQETSALQTQNSASGGFLAPLGNFVNSLVPAATNLYALKLQGQQLKQQYNSDVAAANAAAAAALAQESAAQASAFTTRQMLTWGGIALAAAVILGIVLRRR